MEKDLKSVCGGLPPEPHCKDTENLSSALQTARLQIEQLQKENALLQANCSASEHHISRLGGLTGDFHRLEYEAGEKDRLIADLKRKEMLLEQTVHGLQALLHQQSGNLSFRAARFLQMLNNPHLAGEKSKFSFLLKYFFSKLRGSKYRPDYHAFQEMTKLLSANLEQLALISAGTTEVSAPDAPDSSLLISIVLPVYNQADLVHESIDSVLAQTYPNWELIIINDGSTDDLAKVVKPYLADERIRYFEQPNQKLPKALSNGFCFARGELLTWTSADNNMHPEMLSKLSAFLRNNPDTAMVYADYDVIDEHGQPFKAAWFRPQNKRHPESAELHLPRSTAALNIVQDNFIGASFMYRKQVLKLLGDYDPQLGVEDYDYWMRINAMMKISHLGTEETLYSYRVHSNSLNGRAQELKILDKCRRLMNYEKDRCAFYLKPFEICGTYQPSDLNTGSFSCVFREKDFRPDTKPEFCGKRILLCRGDKLYTYTPQELENYNFIAAYFDCGMANDAGKNAYLIRRFNIHCFARPDSAELRRLQMLTANSLACLPPDLGVMALTAANCRIFFESTRSAEERSRTLPEMPDCGSGKIIVLLDKAGTGGMEQVAYDMTRAFAAKNRTVQLVSFHAPDKDVKLPGDINLHVLDENAPDEAFQTLLLQEETAAVFAHYCTRGAKIAHKHNVPFFQVIHNTYCWFGADDLRTYRENDAFTTAYIAVSANVAWYAAECMNLPEEKIIIIENSIDPTEFCHSDTARNNFRNTLGIGDDEFLFLNPASIYGPKGQMNLIRAFAEAYKINQKLRLLIAGKVLEEQYFRDIQKVIEENNLQNAVITGKYFDNMSDVYNAADAVVLSSFWEGCSLAVSEAVRMKKFLLASRCGDVERQTDCKNCILFDLPFHYLTELTGVNCGAVVYSPDQHMIDSLKNGMLSTVSGDYPRTDESMCDQAAEEVYLRYLKVLNYSSGKLAAEAFRHNI